MNTKVKYKHKNKHFNQRSRFIVIDANDDTVTYRSETVYLPEDGSMTADDFNTTVTRAEFLSKFTPEG